MSQSKTKPQSEDLFAALMDELKIHAEDESSDGLVLSDDSSPDEERTSLTTTEDDLGLLDLNFGDADKSFPTENASEVISEEALDFDPSASTSIGAEIPSDLNLNSDFDSIIPADISQEIAASSSNELDQYLSNNNFGLETSEELPVESVAETPIEYAPAAEEYNNVIPFDSNSEKTEVLSPVGQSDYGSSTAMSDDKTVAVNGYSNRQDRSSHAEDNVKVSVGQVYGSGPSSGYASWGSTDSHLAQVENLKIAQAKILDLERENEKLRLQNEEMLSATDIVKERSDLLMAQVYEYKNDREALESSFKSEMSLLKNQLHRKDAELQKSQMKIEELDSRLKFDMKKIRIRERELENRLELIRAEKNALVRSKDEQILDLRRKMDQLQLEVESYRQKCIDLNKVIVTNQESFKRTTRALRLAMANLELQEENKAPLKKVD